MTIECKKSYGLCNKNNKNVTIEIECLVAESLEGKDYAKNKIKHCPLDLHHLCKREQCPIWLKADFNYRI